MQTSSIRPLNSRPIASGFSPIITELADTYVDRVKVGRINTDQNREVSVRFSVSAIPTVILFNNGAIVEKFIGLRSKKDFETALNKVSDAH